MLKKYLIVSWGYLVKIGNADIEPIDGSTNKVVPEEYRTAVAEYLATPTAL